MGRKGRGGPRASIDDICNCIQSLSDAEWVRIRSFAATLLWGTDFEGPQELVNETTERFVSGSRTWPTDVAFLTCFCNAMKSIADGDRDLIRKSYEVTASDLSEPDAAQAEERTSDLVDRLADPDIHAPSAEHAALTAERRLAAARDVARIQETFRDDDQVSWILMGVEDGIPAADLQAISGMSQTEYETARKRLRRKLTQLFRAGRKQ